MGFSESRLNTSLVGLVRLEEEMVRGEGGARRWCEEMVKGDGVQKGRVVGRR